MASWDLFSSRTRKTVKGNELFCITFFLFKFSRQTILYYKAFRLQIKNDILLQLLEDLFSLSTDNQNWRTNRKVNWKSENWSTIQLCQKMEKVFAWNGDGDGDPPQFLLCSSEVQKKKKKTFLIFNFDRPQSLIRL